MSVKESIVLIGPAIALMIGCSAAPRAIDWRWGPVLPEARSARATTGVGDMAVTVGGTSWKTVDGGKVKRWRRSVYALDPDAGWSMLPAYPHDAGYAAACAIDRRLIVVGGKDADRGHRETYVLDLDAAEPRWTPGPQLPRARWGHVGGVIGSTVYVTGGFESTPEGKGAPAASVLAWDTVSD
ncbi:MAG: hypothetical protein CMJ18_02650, partial [Phycisphaeraceae bacterium]|nr:hypothetical protein [Phycisphaeraceae bacterium]